MYTTLGEMCVSKSEPEFMVMSYDPKTNKVSKWYGTEKQCEKHYVAEDKMGFPVNMCRISPTSLGILRSWEIVKSNGKSWLPAIEKNVG